MLHISEILEEIKATPYEDIPFLAPHTGKIAFEKLEIGAPVKGPSGEWKEIPGTCIATLTRENNPKKLCFWEKGTLVELNKDVDGAFIEAGTKLATIRHYLSKDEVVRRILQKTLFLFLAPERGKYYFVPEVDKKVKISGARTVTVHDGMELFILSRMKRETTLPYYGPQGVIFQVYMENNQNVDALAPLIGVCEPQSVDEMEEVIQRVTMEWEEPA